MQALPSEQQKQMAEKFLASMLTQSKYQLASIKPFVQEMLDADANKDGIISGPELAKAIIRGEELFKDFNRDNFRKYGCKPETAAETAEIVDAFNYNIVRRLDVLNHPQELNRNGKEIAARTLGFFASSLDMSVMHLDPKVTERITQIVENWALLFDKNLIKAHNELVDSKQVGALPKQVLPMSKNDLCGAAQTY